MLLTLWLELLGYSSIWVDELEVENWYLVVGKLWANCTVFMSGLCVLFQMKHMILCEWLWTSWQIVKAILIALVNDWYDTMTMMGVWKFVVGIQSKQVCEINLIN